jgi:serine/threonine protein kinase
MLDYKHNAIQTKTSKENKISYLVLELAEKGELFEYALDGSFQTQVCRFFFKQLLQALEFCHSKNIAHRNLKLQNILLDNNFNIKIVDFALAGPCDTGFIKYQ